MKKSLLISIGFIFLLMVSVVYAHPPSDIMITFDPQTKMLQAMVMHNTSNPLSHYIKKVDIGLNGEEIIELTFSKQENNQSQSVSYSIPNAKEGDVVSVEGYCSISGKLTKEIVIKSLNNPN